MIKSDSFREYLRKRLEQVCGTSDPLALVLSGGDVRRYHQEGHVYHQSVSEHTWRVLVILLHFFPDASVELIKTAIYHDTPERYTGDSPATVKEAAPEVKSTLERMEREFLEFLGLPCEHELPHLDYCMLKCADYIELCITTRCQYGRRADQIYQRGRKFVSHFVEKLPEAKQKKICTFMKDLDTGKWKS